jgi:hypothetical protein
VFNAQEARRAERVAAELASEKLHALLAQRLSALRMTAFEDTTPQANNSASWVVGRYLFSVASAEALTPALHFLEVTLRNAIYEAIATRFAASNGVDIPHCWLDWSANDTVLYRDPAQPWRDDFQKVQAAKREIARDGRAVETGRLIAELSFGFWTGLFAGHYGGRAGDPDPKKLWPDLLPMVFPMLPVEDRKRAFVAERLNAIRKIRNRAFHHEPLWRRRPVTDLKLVTETIGWMDATVAALARESCRAKEVQERGVGGYEKHARAFALKAFQSPPPTPSAATDAAPGAASRSAPSSLPNALPATGPLSRP